jgi:hypothetical protein
MRGRAANRWVMAAVVGLTLAAPARGFYFAGWPGGPRQPPSLLPKPNPHSDPAVDGTPPGTTDSPPDKGPGPVPGDGTHPEAPEPATAVLAAVGLGLAAVRRVRRLAVGR